LPAGVDNIMPLVLVCSVSVGGVILRLHVYLDELLRNTKHDVGFGFTIIRTPK